MIQDSGDNVLYHFADPCTTADAVDTDYKRSKTNHTAVVVDNGSYQCKAGWGHEGDPRLCFRSASTRARGKKGESDFLCVGNDINSFEAVRSVLKTPFDQNVVVNYTCQSLLVNLTPAHYGKEHVLDYVFQKLGLGAEAKVNHPVVMTEPLCNPAYCRAMMSELLFECYSVPAVAYGIDAVFSLFHNSQANGGFPEDALLISCGFQATHILPVVGGAVDHTHCKRLNVGGSHLVTYMQHLVQLQVPSLRQYIYHSRAEELTHHHCYMAGNYADELQHWAQGQQDHLTRRIQLPFHQCGLVQESAPDPKKAALQAERRRKAGERLRELNKKRKLEKLQGLQQTVKELTRLLSLQEEDPDAFEESLESAGFASHEAVVRTLQETTSTVAKMSSPSTLHTSRSTDDATPEEEVSTEWLESLHVRKKELQEKRQSRQIKRQEMSQRRSAASHKRMMIISQLADNTSSRKGKKQEEDTFGMNDDDWSVYREISKDGGGSESEKDEAELMEIDKVLEKHDPKFKKTSMSAKPQMSGQICLGVERCRVPELLYQPSLIGLDQCGLAEAVQLVLQYYPPEVQQRMVQNVFVTGGTSQVNGFEDRLHSEVLAMRPFQSKFRVWSAGDKVNDGWRGAALWSQLGSNKQYFISKSDYSEKGHEYLKPHFASNTVTSLISPSSA